MSGKLIKVEVAFVSPELQFLQAISVVEGCTVREAVHASDLLKKLPALELTDKNVGIFSKLKTLDTVLREGDRVEVYRPLLIDPKEVRRQRALAESSK